MPVASIQDCDKDNMENEEPHLFQSMNFVTVNRMFMEHSVADDSNKLVDLCANFEVVDEVLALTIVARKIHYSRCYFVVPSNPFVSFSPVFAPHF